MQPSTIDLQTPFDSTGFSEITGAQLEQLVGGSMPFTDKGMIVVTTDDMGGNPNVPDATTTTKWQKYFWLRIQSVAAIPYVWNPAAASDATFLQWQTIASATIGIGTIVNAMIADNTIQDVKIANLSYSKLTGTPPNLPPSGAAGGDLTGTYPSPTVGAGVITTAKIAANAITHGLLGAEAVQVPTDIQPSGTGLAILRTNAGASACEWFSVGNNILQTVYAEIGGVIPSSGNLASATDTPNANTTGITDSGIALAFTPISATSTFLIEVTSSYTYNSIIAKGFIGVYTGTGAVAPAGGIGMFNGNGGFPAGFPVAFRCKLASVGTSLLTFYVRFGVTAAITMYLNSLDGSNVAFGIAKTTIKITEVI